jgi:hypothetical protein
MMTVPEIEAALDAVPPQERAALLERLICADIPPGARGKLVWEDGHPLLVAPPGAPPITTDLVKLLLAEFP